MSINTLHKGDDDDNNLKKKPCSEVSVVYRIILKIPC